MSYYFYDAIQSLPVNDENALNTYYQVKFLEQGVMSAMDIRRLIDPLAPDYNGHVFEATTAQSRRYIAISAEADDLGRYLVDGSPIKGEIEKLVNRESSQGIIVFSASPSWFFAFKISEFDFDVLRCMTEFTLLHSVAILNPQSDLLVLFSLRCEIIIISRNLSFGEVGLMSRSDEYWHKRLARDTLDYVRPPTSVSQNSAQRKALLLDCYRLNIAQLKHL